VSTSKQEESSLRIGVLNNLRAGRSDEMVARTLALLQRYPDVVHVETDSARVLPEALGDLLRHDIDLLVLNGGDGTLQFALSELLADPKQRRIPWVAPLRGGRTNMTALDLGAHRNPLRGLENVLRAHAAGRLQERAVVRPVLRVTSRRRGTQQYGMFFGAGMIHRAISLVHELFPPGRSQGVLGASLVTAALVGKILRRPNDGVLAPDKALISLDGDLTLGGEYYLLIASSLQRLFSRMNPFWGREAGGVRFTSISASARRMATTLPRIAYGHPPAFAVPDHGYTSANAERVDLRIDSGFTIDGEIYEPLPDESIRLEADRRVTFVRA